MAGLAASVKEATARADELAERFNLAWLEVPNLVDPTAADGFTDADNLEVKRVGDPRTEGTDHATLGAALGIIDTERAAKVSGSRFGYLKGKGAMLELSLVRWAMDNLSEAGFTPMIPPVLVREHALEGTGFFPEAREQVYAVERDELYLVGTSEVPLAAYHGDEILDGEPISRCVTPGSPHVSAARREPMARTPRGSSGSISSTRSRCSCSRHPMNLRDGARPSPLSRGVIWSRQLEIPYRVVNVAAGDLGASAAKKYDIEAWFPGEQAFREITSCSNTTDFQARRLKVRLPGRIRATPSSTRSTGRRVRWGGPSSPSWRTISSPTGAC